MAEKAILFDSSKCIACRACQVACKQWNELQGEQTVNRGSYENPPDLSPQTWVKINFIEAQRQGKIDWRFTRRACMHCTDAACVKVCPNGTLYKNESGFTVYNKDTCTGCGYCRDFCPFDVPRSTRGPLGIAKMDKCILCSGPGLDRISASLEPACVKTCPTDALEFGDRDTLLAEGRKRVATLKTKGYSNAYLYGEREMGGLHVLYVLDESPQAYGLPANPVVPAAAVAWHDVLKPLGWVAGGLTLVGLGINYVIAREAKMTHELPGKKKEEK